MNDSDDNDDTVQLETGSGLPAGTTWNTQGASWLPTWDYDHDDDDDDDDEDHDDAHSSASSLANNTLTSLGVLRGCCSGVGGRVGRRVSDFGDRGAMCTQGPLFVLSSQHNMGRLSTLKVNNHCEPCLESG